LLSWSGFSASDSIPGIFHRHDEVLGIIRQVARPDISLPDQMAMDKKYSAFLAESLELGRMKEAMTFMLEIDAKMAQRTIFTTRNGQLGTGLRHTRKGDEVWVLEGGRVPYILRSKGHQYELVGDAYIYEIINGEAVKNRESVRKDIILV